MQSNTSRPGSLNMPQKLSPGAPRTGLKLKSSGSISDSFSSPKSKTPNKSPKVVDRRSPRSPAIEKKKTSRVSEMETQLTQLQDELRKAKEQLNLSESCKRRAQQEAEESKGQLAAMSLKLEDTQKQLDEVFDSEESRLQELRKVSQDRDRAWKCELEAVQKQQLMDSNALSSALNEIQRLKIQLNRTSELESGEIQSLREELSKTLDLVENLKNQLNESRESESEAFEEIARVQMLLEIAKAAEVSSRLEHEDRSKSHKLLAEEMEESRRKVVALEETVAKLESDDSKNEAKSLKEALEEGEKRYQEQYIESTMQIREAYEMVKQSTSLSCEREAKLSAQLDEKQREIIALRAKLEENELESLKSALLEKENLLKRVIAENEKLKSETSNEVEAERVTEMETELRRVKVQSEQWRKAAEAAAAILATGENEGKQVERTGTLDYHTIGGKLRLDYNGDTDDESPKKRNGNMLKKFGVLLKKGGK